MMLISIQGEDFVYSVYPAIRITIRGSPELRCGADIWTRAGILKQYTAGCYVHRMPYTMINYTSRGLT